MFRKHFCDGFYVQRKKKRKKYESRIWRLQQYRRVVNIIEKIHPERKCSKNNSKNVRFHAIENFSK